jgi:hypothetical protein
MEPEKWTDILLDYGPFGDSMYEPWEDIQEA